MVQPVRRALPGTPKAPLVCTSYDVADVVDVDVSGLGASFPRTMETIEPAGARATYTPLSKMVGEVVVDTLVVGTLEDEGGSEDGGGFKDVVDCIPGVVVVVEDLERDGRCWSDMVNVGGAVEGVGSGARSSSIVGVGDVVVVDVEI